MPKNLTPTLLLLLTAVLLLPQKLQAQDNLPLWHIPGSDTQAELYLLSDITLLGPRDFPLPDPIENAYTQADLILTYLKDDPDPGQIFQTTLQQHGQTNQPLQQLLPQDDWTLLQENLTQLGMNPAQFQNMSPWAVALLIHQVAAARQDRQQRYFLTSYFPTKARVDGKPVIGITTAQTFFNGIATLDPPAQAAFLRQTLREIAMMDANHDEFRVNWQIGNMAALNDLMQRSRVPDDTLQTVLHQQPAQTWINALQKIQNSHPGKTVLAIIPLNLMSGPDSILRQMRHNTADIQQLTTQTPITE